MLGNWASVVAPKRLSDQVVKAGNEKTAQRDTEYLARLEHQINLLHDEATHLQYGQNGIISEHSSEVFNVLPPISSTSTIDRACYQGQREDGTRDYIAYCS